MKFDLYEGDCMELMKNLPKGSVDTILTDPPYGMAFQSNRAKDGPRHLKLKGDEKPETEWILASADKMKEGGAFILFCDWKTSNIWKEAIENAGLVIRSQVIWNRLHHGMGDLKGAFAPMHDIIWYASKGRRVFINGRPKSVIECRRPSPTEDHGHPTCKPVPLLEKLLASTEASTAGSVFDPFMGSGSTGVACANAGRDFIGMELDHTFFNIAKNRIQAACPDSQG